MRELTAEDKIQIGVKGWVEVRLINREGKVVHEHTQDNLILDKGLNYILSSLRAEKIHLYVAVGTGSSTPTPTQTALDAEVARTNATLSAGPDIEITALADGYYRISRTRTFDYNQANGNLTEFGASETTTGVNTRELFRDANGNPIVITKTSNERLVITYHIEVMFSPVVSTQFGTINFRDNGGNIVDSRIVKHLFTRPSPSSGVRTIDLSLVGLSYRFSNGSFGVTSPSYKSDCIRLSTAPPDLSYTGDVVVNEATGSWSSYASGSFYRDYSYEEGPATSDKTIYGWEIAGAAYDTIYGNIRGRSYVAAFVNADGTPNPFLKNKDYRFKVATRFSIARV